MMAAVQELPSFTDAYTRHGWKLCAIPPATKGPQSSGWNKQENAMPLGAVLPDGWGCGLLHAYSGSCAIDIDDIGLATDWLKDRGVNLQQLLNAADAVQINSGSAGHGKLIYSLPFPLPSKKITVEGKTALEFRCSTAGGLSVQDVLPPSRHPSGSTYQWAGRGHWQRLPFLPAELLSVWNELLAQDTPPPTSAAAPVVNTEELVSALQAIDPDCDHDTWVQCGMALKAAGLGMEVWNSWSAKSTNKYPGERELLKRWESFHDHPAGVTAATVFRLAIDAGWERPAPDVSKMFKPVEAGDAKTIKNKLMLKTAMPKVDLELWPAVLKDRALEVAAEVGCDPVVPLVAGLCAVSGAMDKRINLILNPTWKVPPTVWFMTVGEPSDKKTPGSKPMFKVLHQLEHEDRHRYQTEMLVWQGLEAKHAGELKAYREWQQSADSGMPNAVPPPVSTLPIMPEPLRLVISDATTQKVVGMSEHRPRGFLLYMDEMNRWLTKLSDPRNSDDRGCWVQGYETGHYSMDRVGSGTTIVENMALSVYGNCQPTVFKSNCEAAAADGIIQRFMPIVLNPEHNQMWQTGAPAWASHVDEYEQLVRRAYTLPVADYTLGTDGMNVFKQFCGWALQFRAAERTLKSANTYQTALGKIEGQCARLILMFHTIESPYQSTVQAATVDRACSIMRRFIVPSLRFTFLEVGEQSDQLAGTVFDYLVQMSGTRPTVSLSQLRAAVKTKREKRDDRQLDMALRYIMDDMISAGYAAIHQDHPRFPVWSVNPELHQIFKEHFENVVLAKQFMIDSIEQCALSKGLELHRPMSSAIGLDKIQ